MRVPQVNPPNPRAYNFLDESDNNPVIMIEWNEGFKNGLLNQVDELDYFINLSDPYDHDAPTNNLNSCNQSTLRQNVENVSVSEGDSFNLDPFRAPQEHHQNLNILVRKSALFVDAAGLIDVTKPSASVLTEDGCEFGLLTAPSSFQPPRLETANYPLLVDQEIPSQLQPTIITRINDDEASMQATSLASPPSTSSGSSISSIHCID